MKPVALLLFPCNGNAIEALSCLGAAYRCMGFVDDDEAKQGTLQHGYPVFSREALRRWPEAHVLAVPGSSTSYHGRKRLIEGLGIEPQRFATVVHPAAHVSELAHVGSNVLIMAGVVVTSNALLGDHVCVLPNTVLHHDAVVGAWTLIGSNVTIAGGVAVGENCYVGSGSSVTNGVTIGDGALVGLGSTVIRDVPAHAKVAGNPARLL